MFRRLLNPDSPLMQTMGLVTDCIFLSLFFIVGCVPVITVGASAAALYDAAYRAFRCGDRHSWSRFWESFRGNLKAGIVPGVLAPVCLIGIVKGLVALWNAFAEGDTSTVGVAIALPLPVLALGAVAVLFPMLSRFENTTMGLLKNTVLLALSHPLRTLGLGLILGAAGFLCARYVFPLFFLPALAAALESFLLEPMFKPYM